MVRFNTACERLPRLASLNAIVKTASLALLACLANPANAGTYDGAMGSTSYAVWTGDINGDGQNDVMLIAAKRFTFIPVDDDLIIPILTASRSPTFVLMSNSYGNYTLIANPDDALLHDGAWLRGAQTLTFSGASGSFADSVTIQAANNYQASFVVAMSATSGQLQLTSTTAPVTNPANPTPVTPPSSPLPVCP